MLRGGASLRRFDGEGAACQSPRRMGHFHKRPGFIAAVGRHRRQTITEIGVPAPVEAPVGHG